MSSDQNTLERAADVVTNEKELGKQAPGAPFIVVALSYLAVLLLAALCIAGIIWLSK